MDCPKCGATISEPSRFCNQCGHALARSCPACGGSNTPDAKYCAACGTHLLAPMPPPVRNGPTLSPAERRQLTIVFCDLVGSTALSTRLDVEDLQEVIATYQRLVADVMTLYGGHVARRVGDGALIYFGYPNAGEDDPEQSVRASLALIKAIATLKLSEPQQLRIGIATGLVVVGDLIGTGSAHDQEVVGEGPNLAARLQTLAEPNTIVIADSTRRLIGSVFELEDLGTTELKGFAEPQRAWRVVCESPAKGRFEALRRTQTPMVGRDEELSLLLRRWSQARAGEGRVVLISGEPGIGKSRLIIATGEQIRSERHVQLRYFCSPHHQDSALFPIIGNLERLAEFERGDTPAQRSDKLTSMLEQNGGTERDIALLSELLLLPSERYPTLEIAARAKKEETFEALLRQLLNLARQQPVLMTFEDLHWLDPTSRDLLDHVIERIAGAPVLLLGTHRPEFQPPWAGQAHVTNLTLNRIDRRHGEALVQQLLAIASLSNDIVKEIVHRSDGVPLFIEEMTKDVLEAGARLPTTHLSVPPTLNASLLSRLDRLGVVAKETAQIGATIGREFSYELLALVAQRPERELKLGLRQLVDAGLLFQRGTPPHSDFLFKHSLLQDAAYSTLLRGPRQKLHARIAATLEETFPDLTNTQPQLVARHLNEAGLGERAISYWQRAGALALHRSAGGEAVMHLSNALRNLERLPDEPEKARQELNIRLGLGTALSIAYGSSYPDVAVQYARAADLGRQLGEDKQLFRAAWGSWYANLTTGKTEHALPLANELVEIGERLADQALMLEAYHSRWATSHVLGLNDTTLADTQRGISLYVADRHHAHTYDYGGHDTGVCARAHCAVTLWITGHADQAVEMSLSALELGRSLAHPPSLAHAAWWSATLRQLRGEPQTCRELAELTIRIADEQGSQIFMMCPLLIAWAVFASGDSVDGLQRMEAAITAKRQRVHRFYYDFELLVFAQALQQAAQPALALEVVEEALCFIKSSRNSLFEAEANRLKGVCLSALGTGHDTEAEAWLLRAIVTADSQAALSFKLRAASSLARHWRKQGQEAKAVALLAPIYNQFKEGFDTVDLKEAKDLLKSLS